MHGVSSFDTFLVRPKFRGVTRSHRKVWCVFPSEGWGIKNLRDRATHPPRAIKWPPSHDLCPGCSMDMGTKDHHQCWQWDFHDAGPWSNPGGKTTTWWFKVTFLGRLSDPFKGLSDLQLGDEKVTLNHLGWIFSVSIFSIARVFKKKENIIWTYWHGHTR